jgi:hypothetical protein
MPSIIKKHLSLLGELLASLPRSSSSLLLLGAFIFTAIVISTPELKEIFGLWIHPINLTVVLIYTYYFCVSLAKMAFPSYKTDGRMAAGAFATAPEKIFLPKELHKRYAIHEAAHLITYALYDNKPDKLTAKVNDFRSYPNGNVSFKYETPQTTKKYYENLMLTYLAGYCSEYIMLDGTNHIGSQQDNSDWEHAAKTYLNSFDHEYSWLSNPENEAEARINASTLKELKKSQIQIVEELIRLNSDLIFSIADILMGKDKMETEQCFDVLKDVTLMPAAT